MQNRYLIDTNIYVYLLQNKINELNNCHQILLDTKNDIFISSISLYEICIKYSIGKLKIPDHFFEFRKKYLFKDLSFSMEHSAMSKALPWHHKDPFDRMLIAQAITEKIPVITSDEIFTHYDIKVIQA